MSDAAAQAPAAPEDAAVPLVEELCSTLDAEGVAYCHWKSTASLDRTSSALNDLDLLVRRSDADRFAEVLHRLRFKAAAGASVTPGIASYYGYDGAADRFVHVHAHLRLVVGDDLTKNYHLPLEEAFLDSAVRNDGFLIPSRELEFVVLVIRLILKHATWDAFLVRRHRISRSAHAELAFLRERIDEGKVANVLERHLPFVAPATFAACIRALDPGAGARVRAAAGRRLVADLDGCALRPRAVDVTLKLWRRFTGTARARLGRRPVRKRLTRGGAMIAVVGADGAGKSTLVDSLAAWLSSPFEVERVHLGRPRRSSTTAVVGNLYRARMGLRTIARGRRSDPDASISRLRLLYAVAIARDRYLTYKKARRASVGGALVLCDRFPLAELTLMDAPRVAGWLGARRAGRLSERLAVLERRYYARFRSPDILIVLRVDPEIAVARKPDESADFVRARWREVWGVDWDATPASTLDAARPPLDVLAAAKSLVWSKL